MKSYAPYDNVPAPSLTATQPSGGGAGGVSSVLATIGAIAAEANPVGIAITAALALLAAIGIRIRGTTRHLSFDEVQSFAHDFAQRTSAVLVSTYGATGIAALQERVPTRFLNAMQQFWGLGSSLNQQIAYDVQVNHILYRQLWLFATWIGTNVDADRPETFNQFTRDVFVIIFGQAIGDADLDPAKLVPVSATPPGGTGGGGTGPTPPLGGGGSGAGSEAGLQSVAKYGGLVLAIGLLAYLFSKVR